MLRKWKIRTVRPRVCWRARRRCEALLLMSRIPAVNDLLDLNR